MGKEAPGSEASLWETAIALIPVKGRNTNFLISYNVFILENEVVPTFAPLE